MANTDNAEAEIAAAEPESRADDTAATDQVAASDTRAAMEPSDFELIGELRARQRPAGRPAQIRMRAEQQGRDGPDLHAVGVQRGRVRAQSQGRCGDMRRDGEDHWRHGAEPLMVDAEPARRCGVAQCDRDGDVAANQSGDANGRRIWRR